MDGDPDDEAEVPKGQPEDATVLIVDDAPDVRRSLRDLLEAQFPGTTVVTAASADEALALVQDRAIDLVVTDHRMPGMTGLKLIETLEDLVPGVPRVLMSAFADPRLTEASEHGIHVTAFLRKPLDPADFTDLVGSLLAGAPVGSTRSVEE